MSNIAIIGSGKLGIKIAGDMAFHGHRVLVFDPIEQGLDNVFNKVDNDKQELQKEGILQTPDYKGAVLCFNNLQQVVKDADFIFEAIADDLRVKVDMMKKITALCKPDSVVGTNSLNLKVDDIFSEAQGKERCMGLRFLYPVITIPEVEARPCSHTSRETLEKVDEFLKNMGKILHFRPKGRDPLILMGEEIYERKLEFLEKLKSSHPTDKQGSSDMSWGKKVVEKTKKEKCKICMERDINSVICPCQHEVGCFKCTKDLHNKEEACPICRTKITDVGRILNSSDT